MASSFFGLYVQRDAIQLAQKALDITGHNITNINTEGYSRQRLDVCAVANTKGTLGYNTSITLAGKGADAVGVTQIRDKLLDGKVRKYSSELCDTGAKTTILADIEDILDDVENEETGLAAIFGDWKATFQSFSATGADRQDLSNICLNSAQSVINVLKNFETRLDDVETATMKDIEANNSRVNIILQEMAGLNKQIVDAYVQMDNVNATEQGYMAEIEYGPLELKDQFNVLADELSQYLNITVTEQKEGYFDVSFGDKALVQYDKYAKTDMKFVEGYVGVDEETKEAPYTYVELYVSSANTEKGWKKSKREITPEVAASEVGPMVVEFNKLIDNNDIEEAFRLETEIIAAAQKAGVDYSPIFVDHIPAGEKIPEYAITFTEETDDIAGGSIKGLFDMFNGEGCYCDVTGNPYRGIKYYHETIRSFAKTMVNEFNALYAEYNAEHPDDQFKLFDFTDGELNVESLKIADSWQQSPIRCVNPDEYNYDELDNHYLNKILSAFEKRNDFGTEPLEYTFEEFITFYGNTIGSQLEYELSDFDSTTTMLESVSEAREEVMGVSMDEEGVNMMNYQKWYNAISRMLTALDECLDKLINGTGVVGL